MANAGPQADRSQVESDEAQASIKSMVLRRKSVEKLAEIVQSKGATPAKVAASDAEDTAGDDDNNDEESS